jgi:hypothetical protein
VSASLATCCNTASPVWVMRYLSSVCNESAKWAGGLSSLSVDVAAIYPPERHGLSRAGTLIDLPCRRK